ncbi:AfsR/SARP family transcriptional regulator [Phytoactinopolyspora endophytica]|uniref:AfsR/SARP family transcriptional regulator n=1 Tax=Phytoactinopolyspora endophytica TaxID=1642495 RepID=UPI0013ECDB4F|nr:AfsR/SARP family transcriptional regulator [Phytoactinopolyspora endophytica]
MIDIRVLGPLDIHLAGERLTVPGAKPRVLLSVLGLQPRTMLPGDVLQSMLWGDDFPPTAHKALQTHISTLRRTLGDGIVLTRGTGWLLATDDTDAEAFTRLIQTARDCTREGAHEAAIAHFDEALGLWRGPPELPATPRARAEVTRWIEAHESAVDDRVDVLLSSGHAAELVGELEAAVADTPLRERRWCQLCLAFFRAGRQGDALRAYHRARDVLADELGVEPSPELRRLETAILTHDTSLELRPPRAEAGRPPPGKAHLVTAAGGHSGIPAPQTTTFVGRREELARLTTLLDQHRIVTVAGPGGVGKTRLAIAAAQSAAPEFPQGSIFADLAPVGPEFVIETVASAAGIVEQHKLPIEDALHQHVGAARILLVLDNCEHVVPAVGPFVERMVAACPRVVVLSTSRERLGADGERVFSVPTLPVLDPGTGDAKGSDASALFLDRVRAVEPEFDADPALVSEVCTRCDGLPLAIELAAARCASLGIDGLLAGLDDRLRLLVGAHSRTERHRSLRAVLDWGHDLLHGEEQALFQQMGVFAGTFDLAAATAVAGEEGAAASSRSGVADLVGRLTDKHLLVHVHTSAGSRWRMLGVVRSYAREQLAASGEEGVVRRRHLRWASSTAAELTHRLDAGGPWRDEFTLVTGDLRAALASTVDNVEETGHQLTLALALARLHARSGAFTVAQGAYEEAMSMARATRDPDQLARAALGASMAGMLFGVAQSKRVALLEEALGAHGDEPSATRARLLARLSTELYWSPDRDKSLRLADEAVELADDLDDPGARAHALYAQCYVNRGPGAWHRQIALARQITGLARRSGETQLELAGRATHAVGLLHAGDVDNMDAEIELLNEAADLRDHPEFQWYATVYRYVRALLAGRFEDADELALSAQDSSQHAPELAIGLLFAEEITDLREFHPVARRYRAAKLAEMVERFPRVLVWRCLALLNDVEPREAEALCQELLAQSPPDDHWLVGCCLLAETVAELDHADVARPLAMALEPYAGNLAVAGRVAACRGSVSHALGLLALTCGDADQAVDWLDQAASQHERIRARPFQARSLLALARALDERCDDGDRHRAASARRQAADLRAQLGLPAL